MTFRVEKRLLIGGKASKRSKFGATSGEKLARTIWATKLCEKAGLRYHVIDSELKMNYLMGHEVKKVIEPEQNVVTVLTFASRHINSIRIMRQCLRSVPGTDRLAVCVVAGNRAFLDWRELRRPVRRSLVDFLKWLRGRHADIQTFVGTERIEGVSIELARKFDAVPFLLLDNSLKDTAKKFRENIGTGSLAVYVPFIVSENYQRIFQDMLTRMLGYFLRRRWVQEEVKLRRLGPELERLKLVMQERQQIRAERLSPGLLEVMKEASEALTVYGSPEVVTRRLRQIHQAGCNVIVGLPIKEDSQQTLTFGECLRKIGE